tara:strand:- start:753 stop:1139 length:387 start_codon:yes stop_codon:yes gene_type:complete
VGKMSELERQTQADDIACTNNEAYKVDNDLVYKKNEYNGWKNYETWNVVLWINNDKIFYDSLKNVYNKRAGRPDSDIKPRPLKTIYEAWLLHCDLYKAKTPDGVLWADKKIDLDEVNEHLCEMLSNEE